MESYFKVTFSTPFSLYDVVVFAFKSDAKYDAKQALLTSMNLHASSHLVKATSEPVEVTKEEAESMHSVKYATTKEGKQWAWVKRLQ